MEKMMVKINQMKKDELFEGFYLIKSAEVRQTRAGKNYLAFVFQDETGTIGWARGPYVWTSRSLQ